MKFTELKEKTNTELVELLKEKSGRVDELRFLLRQKKVKNVKELAAIKKDIARILTQMNAGNLTN